MASRTGKGGKARTGRAATGKRKSRKRAGSSHHRPFFTVDHFIDFVGIGLTTLGLLTFLAMLPSMQPSLGQSWLDFLRRLFGAAMYLVPLALLALGIWLVARRFVDAPPPPWYRLVGLFLLGVSIVGSLGFLQQWRAPGALEGYGGLVGYYLVRTLTLALGAVAAPVALFFLAILGVLLLLEISLADMVSLVARWRNRPQALFSASAKPSPVPAPVAPAEQDTPSEIRQLPLPPVPGLLEQTRTLLERFRERFRPEPDLNSRVDTEVEGAPDMAPNTRSFSIPDTPWRLPPWPKILEDIAEEESDWEDIRRKTQVIEETLAHFGVPARVVEVNHGPTVTQYGVEPGFLQKRIRGQEQQIKVKVSAITNLHNDLALALAAPRIRIEAPVPGKHYVGIEVPNDHSVAVTLRGTMETEAFRTLRAPLGVALGRDVTGNAVVADLARMPHLLIAGATGSGKSVCINSIIACLLCHNTPDLLKLLMIDPKMVELTGYNGIPHLIVPVVTELERVIGLLRWTVNEMERRYKIFSREAVRNLQAYNSKMLARGEKPLPYLVMVIDELADLMMAAPEQVETMICRLAQMARATGIHMILATQRPSVDVVTGLIKANFPARVAFAVSSSVDSRVILDSNGAESLLGRGDMLYQAPDASGLTRAQGCYMSDSELEMINRFWREQAAEMSRPKAVTAELSSSEEAVEPLQPVLWEDLLSDAEEEEDELLPRARELIAERGRASISMLQRRLRVGYARAARLVDLLEAEGTIGASAGPGKHRNILIDDEDDEGTSA